MDVRSAVAILSLSLAASVGYAGTAVLPEPGVVELLAIGAVAGIAVAIRKRRR